MNVGRTAHKNNKQKEEEEVAEEEEEGRNQKQLRIPYLSNNV